VFDVDGAPSHRCSASLLSPTVILTAGLARTARVPRVSGSTRLCKTTRNTRSAARCPI